MPVYDYTYQTWEGRRRGPLFRWLAMAKFTYMTFFGKRAFIWLFTVAWLQMLLRVGYIYLMVNLEVLDALDIPSRALPPVNVFFFKNLIDVQMIFCFLFAFQVGSGLISRDLKHSAAVLFMSKPISRWEYFLGKFVTLFGLLMLITWFQCVALFVLQTATAGEQTQWRLNFWNESVGVLWSSTAYSAIVCSTITLMVLACSSLTKNSRYAGLTFAVYVIGSSIVAQVVSEILGGNGQGLYLSPFISGVELGYYLFGLRPNEHEMSRLAAWMGILHVWAVCVAILYWRLRSAARYGR